MFYLSFQAKKMMSKAAFLTVVQTYRQWPAPPPLYPRAAWIGPVEAEDWMRRFFLAPPLYPASRHVT